MYIIARGDVDILVISERKRLKRANILRPGSHFGEVALLTDSPRSATARALNYVTLGVLTSDGLQSILQFHPNLTNVLKLHMHKYNDRYKAFKLRMI